jgi:hypothetical protein
MKTLAPAVSALQAVHHLMHDVHHHHHMELRMPLYFLVIQVALCETKGKARILYIKRRPNQIPAYQMTSGYQK